MSFFQVRSDDAVNDTYVLFLYRGNCQRVAIAENSYGGVVNFKLSSEEMKLLDSLDVNYKSGKLGRRDGWNDEDVTSIDWDPTEAYC